MINHIVGNLVEIKSGIIAHQVNIFGVSGSGVVVAIKNKFSKWESEYSTYVNNKGKGSTDLIGNTLIHSTSDSQIKVLDIFSQVDFHKGSANTDKEALYKGLVILRTLAESLNLSANIPFKLASDRGGLSWDADVYPMLEEIFKDSDVELNIISLT